MTSLPVVGPSGATRSTLEEIASLIGVRVERVRELEPTGRDRMRRSRWKSGRSQLRRRMGAANVRSKSLSETTTLTATALAVSIAAHRTCRTTGAARGRRPTLMPHDRAAHRCDAET